MSLNDMSAATALKRLNEESLKRVTAEARLRNAEKQHLEEMMKMKTDTTHAVVKLLLGLCRSMETQAFVLVEVGDEERLFAGDETLCDQFQGGQFRRRETDKRISDVNPSLKRDYPEFVTSADGRGYSPITSLTSTSPSPASSPIASPSAEQSPEKSSVDPTASKPDQPTLNEDATVPRDSLRSSSPERPAAKRARLLEEEDATAFAVATSALRSELPNPPPSVSILPLPASSGLSSVKTEVAEEKTSPRDENADDVVERGFLPSDATRPCTTFIAAKTELDAGVDGSDAKGKGLASPEGMSDVSEEALSDGNEPAPTHSESVAGGPKVIRLRESNSEYKKTEDLTGTSSRDRRHSSERRRSPENKRRRSSDRYRSSNRSSTDRGRSSERRSSERRRSSDRQRSSERRRSCDRGSSDRHRSRDRQSESSGRTTEEQIQSEGLDCRSDGTKSSSPESDLTRVNARLVDMAKDRCDKEGYWAFEPKKEGPTAEEMLKDAVNHRLLDLATKLNSS